mgnify:CR=1 FL=1
MASSKGKGRDGKANAGAQDSGNQSRTTAEKWAGLKEVPGFADLFLVDGAPPAPGHRLCQPALARTLESLAENGLASFYKGAIAAAHAAYLSEHGSPLRQQDFSFFQVQTVTPLRVESSWGSLYNMPPPTQGVASLMILAIFDRLNVDQGEGFAHLHGLIEATKQAFLLRNAHLGDPSTMAEQAQSWLDVSVLDKLTGRIDREDALDGERATAPPVQPSRASWPRRRGCPRGPRQPPLWRDRSRFAGD